LSSGAESVSKVDADDGASVLINHEVGEMTVANAEHIMAD